VSPHFFVGREPGYQTLAISDEMKTFGIFGFCETGSQMPLERCLLQRRCYLFHGGPGRIRGPPRRSTRKQQPARCGTEAPPSGARRPAPPQPDNDRNPSATAGLMIRCYPSGFPRSRPFSHTAIWALFASLSSRRGFSYARTRRLLPLMPRAEPFTASAAGGFHPHATML
jgi:hypothetical protein